MANTTIILGSGSPRRSAILTGMSIAFIRRPVDIDESILRGEAPLSYVRRLALSKARCAAERFGQGNAIALGADTIVVLDSQILGKPKDNADAAAMLRKLSGMQHEVTTAVALVKPDGSALTFHETTSVSFRDLSEADIQQYVDTGSPRDKAGAYGIQDDAANFVSEIAGSFSNVVGLPVERLVTHLVELELLERGLMSRLTTIRGRMAAASPSHIVRTRLIGASKGQNIEAIKAMQRLGLSDFGESYVQEWENKATEITKSTCWHFMGRIQSNKLKRIVSRADIIHTVASEKHLRAIDRHAREANKKVVCLLQVNIGGEESKGGIEPSQVKDLLMFANGLENVECRGLMTLPPRSAFGKTRGYFRQLRALAQEYFGQDEPYELSMGMSDDLEIAISQGATMIRVGTALFGPRR